MMAGYDQTIPAMPTILRFWPNRAEIIVVTTMPPAHQVIRYSKFTYCSAPLTEQRNREYKATDPND